MNNNLIKKQMLEEYKDAIITLKEPPEGNVCSTHGKLNNCILLMMRKDAIEIEDSIENYTLVKKSFIKNTVAYAFSVAISSSVAVLFIKFILN